MRVDDVLALSTSAVVNNGYGHFKTTRLGDYIDKAVSITVIYEVASSSYIGQSHAHRICDRWVYDPLLWRAA